MTQDSTGVGSGPAAGASAPGARSLTAKAADEFRRFLILFFISGSYSAFSFAAPERAALPIRDIYEANKKSGQWGLIAAQSAAQAILAFRVLEKAIAKVGADNVTGEAMRNALIDNVYTEKELLGALPTIDYDNTAPFPIGEIKATAEVVKDGKIVQVGDDWMAVPKLEKW